MNQKNNLTFIGNDLFCTGQLQLRDGNVFYNGGTEYYLPWFTGPKTMYIFNWTHELLQDWDSFDWTQMPGTSDDLNINNDTINIAIGGTIDGYSANEEFYPWMYVGEMEAGRWYPRSVELLDGRFVIFSGTIDWDNMYYNTQANPNVGFFNYDEFLKSGPVYGEGIGYRWINSSKQLNSPFMTRLDEQLSNDELDEICSNRSSNTDGTPGANYICREQLKNDSFPLYPQNYLMPDGRIFITQNGASYWVVNGGAPRKGKFTYFVTLSGNETDPIISWERGPDHKENVLYYGTSVHDPNDDSRIDLFGGVSTNTIGVFTPGIISGDQDIVDKYGGYYNYKYTLRFNGNRATRLFEVFQVPDNISQIGGFIKHDENYLGPNYEYDRTMHYSTLLPTKQILFIGGGNYNWYSDVKSPLLLTPIYDDNDTFTGEYSKDFMAPGYRPRSYHSIALLLPDGRVISAGGNPMAAVLNWTQPISYENGTYTTKSQHRQPKPNLDRIFRGLYYQFRNVAAEGFSNCEAEVWEM